MKKSIILFLILSISLSANAAEYTEKNTRPCPQNKELVCDQNEAPITGLLISYYDDGKLKSEEIFKDGKKEGLARVYYKNGELQSEKNYMAGRVEGLVKTYYENANLKREEVFKDGNLEGFVRYYYKNGKVKGEENYTVGKKDGVERGYYENGRLKSEIVFKEGKAISGFIYNEYGEKREMTNAHLHNMNMLFKPD